MTASPITDRRQLKAQSIVEAGDIHESKPGVWRVRDKAGSGTWHYVTSTSCSCIDFQRSGLRCKHQLALANWSTKPAGPVCPSCGAATYAETFYVGGRGYCSFRVCTADKYHRAVRLT